jgi:hypothetical protein
MTDQCCIIHLIVRQERKDLDQTIVVGSINIADAVVLAQGAASGALLRSCQCQLFRFSQHIDRIGVRSAFLNAPMRFLNIP